MKKRSNIDAFAHRMDQLRQSLIADVEAVEGDPATPEHVKRVVRNFAGLAYFNAGVLDITVSSNRAGVLSPFASMRSTINVDFHGHVNNLGNEVQVVDPTFRHFEFNVTVQGVQLIQKMLYTKQIVTGRYVTQKQVSNMNASTGRLIKSFVTTLRSREGAMSCAGVDVNTSCNKSNIGVLICKIEVDDHRYVCAVPFCRGHARVSDANRNKRILKDKRIYLLSAPLIDQFYGDDAKTTGSDQGDQFLVEEDDMLEME